MTPKERITKHKASVKKHFLAKRLAKAKASNSNTADAPKHKASPPSTAGKTISYFKGKSTVVDLGHKPSKSAISGAVAKLRKAQAATKPKATSAPPSAAKAPEIKLPNAPKPTTPNPATKKSAKGDVWAGLAIAAGATGLVAGAVKLAMKTPTPKPAATVKVKQLTLPAPNKGLPKSPLGLPGGKQSDRVAQVKEIQRKGKVLFDLQEKSAPGARRHAAATPSPGTKAQAAPELKAASDARRGKQGAGLKNAFETIERADSRAGAKPAPKPTTKPTTKVISLGKKPSPIKIAEARAKGQATPATRESSMTAASQDARARGAIARGSKGLKDPATAVQKSEHRAADRRSGEPRRSTARMTRKQAGVESGAGIRNESPLANKQGNRRKKGSDPRVKIEGVKTTPTTGAPKPVDRSSGGQAPITKTAAPNVAQVPKAAVVKAAPAKVAAVRDGGEPKANKATSLMSGEARQAANQAAREALRSGDPVAAKKALAGLPETGRKAGRYRASLKAGAVGGGSGAAPKAPARSGVIASGGLSEAERQAAAPKVVSLTGAQRQGANQAARAAMRSGDVVAMKKALATLPETGKKAVKYRANLEAGIQSAGYKPAAAPTVTSPKADPKLKAALQAERAKNAKLKAAAPADQALFEGEKAAARAKKPSKDSYKQRKQNYRDRQNRIDPKTQRPMPLDQSTRTVKEIEAHQTRNLMETTIDEKRVTPERSAAEARERANKLGQEAQTELVVRAGREAVPTQGKAPTPTGREPANRGAPEAVSRAAVKSPEAPRVTVNEAAHEKQQRFNAEGRQTENVNIKELAKEVQAKAKLGQSANLRQAMARGAATAVLKQSAEPTSAAKPKVISLTSQSSTPAPKVSKADAYRNYEALKETGVKSPTAGKVKPKAKAPAKTDTATRKPLKPKGEQLPRSPAGGRVISSIADAKAEQARGDTSPPKTPAKAYPAMNKPSKFTFADSIRKYAERITKPLTSPGIGSNVNENITKPSTIAKARKTAGKVGGPVGAALLTGLVLAETAEAAYHAPAGKKAEAAKQTAKTAGIGTAVTVGAFSAGLKALSMISAKAGAVGSRLLSGGAVLAIGKGGYDIGSLAGKEVAQIGEAKKTAKREKAYSEQFYGTVEKATKTRHAKEAFKRVQKKQQQRDLLTGGK